MEERSAFFVELPQTSGLRERGIAVGESLRDFAAQATSSVASWASSAAASLSSSLSSLVAREDSWNDFRDKCRPWLFGFGIALVLFIGITFVSSAIISARYPHHAQHLHLHAGQYDSQQAQPQPHSQAQSDSHSQSVSQSQVPGGPAVDALHSAEVPNHSAHPGEAHTQGIGNGVPKARQSHGTSDGSGSTLGDGEVEQGDASGNTEPGDTKDSLLVAALETEALQLPGLSTRAELAASGDEREQQRQKILGSLNPTVEVDQGVVLIWQNKACMLLGDFLVLGVMRMKQIPPRPRAVLLLVHGCGKGPTFFWPKHPNCTHCIGLPEETAVTAGALRRGYAVVSACMQHSSCWDASWPQPLSLNPSFLSNALLNASSGTISSSSSSLASSSSSSSSSSVGGAGTASVSSAPSDVAHVSSAIQSWRAAHDLEHVPLYGWGISSGGPFVMVLAHALPFKAMAVYLSAGHPRALSSGKAANSSLPPTLFVHMPRDARTAKAVTAAVQGLKRRGVQAAQVRCRRLPLTPLFLSDRIPLFPVRLSQEIFGALKLRGFLDHNGSLLNDPRGSQWQQVLRRDGILTGRGVGSSAQDGLRGRWGKGVFAILHGRAKLLAKHAQGGREGLGERHVTGSLGRRRGIRGRGARADRGGQSGRLMWQRMRRREARADRGGQSGRLRRQQGLRRRAQGAWAYRETSDSQWQQMAVAQELNVAYGFHEVTSSKATETFDWLNDRCWYKGRYRHHRCGRYYDPRTSSA